VGDSHMMWSIDDAKIPGLRNISLNAEGYKYTYLKLQHLLENEHGLTRLYVGVGYHSFSSYFDEYIHGATFHRFAERYLSVMTSGDYAELLRSAPLHALGLAQGIVQRGFKTGLKGECMLYGRFPEDRKTATLDRRTLEVRIREQFYEGGRVVETSTSNLEYLEKIVALGRAHGLDVILLSAPLHPEYARRVPEVYRRKPREFAQHHGLALYTFDDMTLTDAQVLPDGDHTNYDGAMITTEHFKRYHERQ
jgi:hypothetical protein